MSKLGAYIDRLMTTVVDKEQEGFIKDLALTELSRLNVDIEEFIRKNISDNEESVSEKTIKTLLQEDTKDGKKWEWNDKR